LYLSHEGGSFFLIQAAIAVDDSLAGDSGDAVTGNDNSGEVDWVGGGYGDRGGALAAAGGAEGLDCMRECELLAAKTGDEAAAANLATGFEAAKDAKKVAPTRCVGLADEKIADEDTVAAEECASC
jgi:hypothetical protein